MVQRGLNLQYNGFFAPIAKSDIIKKFKLQQTKLKNILHTYNGRSNLFNF